MALFNYASKELTLKVVYYGPGLSGKTTNIQHLHATLNPANKGKLLSLATETDRTLFFDFLPVTAGRINDFNIKFQLYTVPGQIRYNSTRKLVLKGADGVVFVADSQREMRQYNKESFQGMLENLRSNGLDPGGIPIVLQYNKRDLRNSMSVEELDGDLNTKGYAVFLASAVKGDGVEETFKGITEILMRDLEKKNGPAAQNKEKARDKEKPLQQAEETRPGLIKTGEEAEPPTLEDEYAPADAGFHEPQTFDPESLQHTLLGVRPERQFFGDISHVETAETGAAEEEEAAGHEKYSNGMAHLMAVMEELQKTLDALALRTENMDMELKKSSAEQLGALRKFFDFDFAFAKENQAHTRQQETPAARPEQAPLSPEAEKKFNEIKDIVTGLPAAVLRAVSPCIESLQAGIESLQADRKAAEKEMAGASQALASGLTGLKHLQEETVSLLKKLHEEKEKEKETLKASKRKKGFFSRLLG